MKARWNLVIGLGALVALALPGAPALARGPHGDGMGQMGHGARHGAFVWHNGHRGDGGRHVLKHKQRQDHGKHQYHRLWQFEGVVASFDGATLVLHPRFSNAISATVAVSSSTVITATEGVSATLAPGEQVHVQAVRNPDGSFTALRIRIQRSGAVSGDPTATPPATGTPEATATDQATATPTAPAATDTATPADTATPPPATATPTS